MKAESNIMPQKQFVVDKVGEQAVITFFTDINAVEVVEGENTVTKYEYNCYTISVPYQDDLETIVAESIQTWVDAAIEAESTEPKPTIEERLASTETKVVTIKETIDTLFGGAI